MRRGFVSLRRVAALLTCAAMVLCPCRIYARPFIQIEVDDTEKFGTEMKKFLAGEGFDGPQMKEFLRAPKREWAAILDRFTNQFGFSPEILSKMLSGRVIVRIDKDAFLVGSVQKDAETVQALIAETKKFIESSANMEAKIEEGQNAARITLSALGNTLLIGARDNRFVVTGGSNPDAAEELCDQFIVNVIDSVADRKDICPELRGDGILMLRDMSAMISTDITVDGRPTIAGMFGIPGPSLTRIYFQDNDLWMVGYLPDHKSIVAPLYLKGPVSESSLSWLPADCASVGALHFNLPGLVPALLAQEAVAGRQGLSIGQSLEMLKRMIGFDLQNDLLAHIGDEIVFGQLPVGKGGGFPLFSAVGLGSMYSVISLKDPVAFEAGLNRILMVLGGMAAMDTVGGGMRRTTFAGLSIRYLRLAAGILSPCFAIKGDHLVVASNVPLMKWLLANHGSWKKITEDGDFQASLALLTDKPTSGFSYKRHLRSGGVGGATAAFTGVAITGILAGMLLPAFSKARGEASKAVCKNNLKQIGLGCKMYAMDHEDRWPKKLSDLHSEYINGLEVFACSSTGVSITKHEEIDTKSSYVFIAGGMRDAEVSTKIVAYEKKGIHERGGNVLFGDGHVEWLNDARLAQLLPTPPVVHQALPAAPGGPGPEQAQTTVFTVDSLGTFLTTEARNLATSIDFALFPAIEDFDREGSSNVSMVEVREAGLFSKAKIGHTAGGSGSDVMLGVAVIAIVAAIAIPSLLRSRNAAIGGLK